MLARPVWIAGWCGVWGPVVAPGAAPLFAPYRKHGVSLALMHVLFSVDRAYVAPLCVAITSLLSHQRGRPVTISVIVEDAACADIARIRAAVAPFDGVSLAFLKLADTTYRGFPVSDHFTTAAYVRLFLSDILPASVDKVLYLDADLVVCADLLPLWETDVTGYALAAVPDPLSRDHAGIGVTERRRYFNSGVMLINLRHWREHAAIDQFAHCIAGHAGRLRYFDQDVLNICFGVPGLVRYLDYTWNFQPRIAEVAPGALGLGGPAFVRLRAAPCIVHFTTRMKPWRFEDEVHYKEVYQHYERLTPGVHGGRPAWQARVRKLLWMSRLRRWIRWHAPGLIRLAVPSFGRPSEP